MSGLLLDVALKATAVLLLAIVLDLALRRASAADRHLLWTVAAAALLAVPLLSATAPSIRWPAVPAPRGSVVSVEDGTSAARASARPERSDAATARSDGEGAATARTAGEPAAGTTESMPRASAGAGEATVSARGPVADADGAGAGPGFLSGLPAFTLLLWLWAAGAGAVLLHLLTQAVRCVRLRRAARPVGPGRTQRTARRLAREMGLDRLPQLLEGPAGAMPSTWGLRRHRVLLPPAAATWPGERLEAVLAHELAHVRRGDCRTQLVAAAACVLYWFHPLVWVAARRMEAEREHACDDEALALGARPSRYAGSLLDLARSVRGRHLSGAVATAMARRAGLRKRVDAVLSPDRCRRGLSGGRAALFGALGAAVALPIAVLQPLAAPAASAAGTVGLASVPPPVQVRLPQRSPSDPCWAPDVPHSMRVHHDDGEHRLTWEGPDCESAILVSGVPTFDEDFDAITALPEGGLVRVEETSDGVRRRVEMRPGDGEGVRVDFWRDGRERPLDGDARSWIRRRVVTILRRTGLAAGERTAWILRREGPEGVFREVELMSSDRAQALYLRELLDRSDLDDPGLRRWLSLSAARVGSDGSLARLLEEVVRRGPERVTRMHRDAFVEATRRIGSDGDLTRLAFALVEARPEDAATIELALAAAAASVGSDGDMSRLLVRVAREAPGQVWGPVRDVYLEAAGTVGSDGDLRRALTMLVRQARGDPEAVALALDAAVTIGSDGDMAAFLVAVARAAGEALGAPELRARYLRALDSVGSDSDERRARVALERATGGRG